MIRCLRQTTNQHRARSLIKSFWFGYARWKRRYAKDFRSVEFRFNLLWFEISLIKWFILQNFQKFDSFHQESLCGNTVWFLIVQLLNQLKEFGHIIWPIFEISWVSEDLKLSSWKISPLGPEEPIRCQNLPLHCVVWYDSYPMASACIQRYCHRVYPVT